MSRGTHQLLDPANVDALVELVNTAYRGESSKQGWTTEADMLDGQRIDAEKVREILQNKDQVVLAWPSESEPQKLDACVFLERRGAIGYLGLLTVRPHLQNAGWGRRILQTSEEWIREQWKMNAVEMNVITTRTELIDWYVRRGYVVTQEKRPFPMQDVRFGRPKVDHLEFVVLRKSLRPEEK